MTTDQELLRNFVEDRSDAAFTELVRRHQDMVYSVCLRRLGQTQQAQDAAQLTFLALLRKAATLLRHPCPAGWLHRTASLEARALAKKESNRQRFETAMSQQNPDPGSPTADERLTGLDEALLELRERDRHTLVLRFFEGRSLRELGGVIGASEEAARKRVARALEQLSVILKRRGATTCTTASLATLLMASTHSAPAQLLPAMTAAARQWVPATGAMAVATLTKIKIAALCTLTAGIPAALQWRENASLRMENQRLSGELSLAARALSTFHPSPPPPSPVPRDTPHQPSQGSGPVMENPWKTALSALLSSEARQVDESRQAKLTWQLELDPSQQETARQIMATFRQKRAAGIALMAGGQVTLTAVKQVLRADLMAVEAFRPHLKPGQIPAYGNFLATETASFAESSANAELARLHALLQLTEPQKDALFNALAAMTRSFLTLAHDSTTSLEQVSVRWEALQKQEMTVVEPLLDEAQLPVYREQADQRRAFVRQFLTAASPASQPLATDVEGEAPVSLLHLTATDGQPVTIPLAGAKATVLIFTSTTCPIANGFAPELKRIDQAFRSQGISLMLVQTEVLLTPHKAKEHATQYGFNCPVVLDPEHTLAKTAGATVTPEAVVLSPGGEILYRGRIDDRFREVGQNSSEPRHTELRDALNSILAGQPVAVPRAPAKGCYIE